jgi:hypothetical protein
MEEHSFTPACQPFIGLQRSYSHTDLLRDARAEHARCALPWLGNTEEPR